MTHEYSVSASTGSIAYFCATCGEVWGRIHAGSCWRVLHRPCESHSPSGVFDADEVPGALSSPFADPATWEAAARLEAMPPAVLGREFEVHLRWMEHNDER